MDASDHIDGQARDGLIRQLVDWAQAKPRTYGEAMEAWPSTCPALTIWEDALAARLIEVRGVPGAGTRGSEVRVTDAGRAWLSAAR